MVLVLLRNQYRDPAVMEKCQFVECIRRDLQSFQPGEEIRVKNVMDYVVAFKDREVEPGIDDNRLAAIQSLRLLAAYMKN